MADKNYAAEPMAYVPEMKDLLDKKVKEQENLPVVEDKPFVIEKITRSCDRSISVNFHTYKVATTISATVKKRDASDEEIEEMSQKIYAMAEKQTLAEINKIATALGRGQ